MNLSKRFKTECVFCSYQVSELFIMNTQEHVYPNDNHEKVLYRGNEETVGL